MTPPKIVFKEDDVVQAAFEIVAEKGLSALTARNVAKKLKSSPAPIYNYFKNMEDLEYRVVEKAKDLVTEYSSRSYTDKVFLNMGVGLALFARDHSNLFRAIFLERSDFKDIVDEFISSLAKNMPKDPRFVKMPEKNRNSLLNKMWIFTHGLASLICVGYIEDDSQEFITNFLLDVGAAVIAKALAEFETTT